MRKKVLRNGLSNRAWNVLVWTLAGSPWETRAKIDRVLGLSPNDVYGELLSLLEEKDISIKERLLRTKGCGPVVAEEILLWIGLKPSEDLHACVCRRCGRRMP